jgi:tricorn protease
MTAHVLTASLIARFVLGAAWAGIPAGAVEMNLVMTPALSRDGKKVVFEWLGDLWTAESEGGEATRVVEHPAHDGFPKFSSDGERMVFSSERTGSLQVFSTPLAGGEVKQHTFHSEGNELQCVSADGRYAMIRGQRERAGLRATRLIQVNLEEDEREQRLFDATASSGAWSPDGTRVLFCRFGEQRLRQGYRGSRASQIWLYELATGDFSPLAVGETEARAPMWLPDGSGFYHLSSRDGTSNLWEQPLNGGTPRQLTHFKGQGIYQPCLSADGSAMVFSKGTDLFLFHPLSGSSAEPIRFWTWALANSPPLEKREIQATASADFTPDLKQVIFASAGELWWIKRKGEDPVRLTHSPEAEDEPRFSLDGRWLYFSKDDGLDVHYYRCKFESGSLTEMQQLTRNQGSKRQLRVSPDSSRIAWTEGIGDLFCAMADGKDARCILKCWDQPTFDWSPGGHWLAVATEDRNANRDIWLVPVAAERNAINLTRHPAFEGSPRWSPDGRFLVFSAKRGADQKIQLWNIDFGNHGSTGDLTKSQILKAAGSAKLLPTPTLEPTRTLWAPDSKSLWFQNQNRSDKTLYAMQIADGTVSPVAKARGLPIRMTDQGDLLWRVNQVPAHFRDGELMTYPIRARLERRRDESLKIAFRRVWRTLRERFHDPEIPEATWNAMRDRYEDAATGARSSRQFDHVINLLFGELNASHLSLLRKPWNDETKVSGKKEPRTAHPGLVFRDGGPHNGPLVIERVLPGSRVARLANAPSRGETIVRIAGEEVNGRTPLQRFFNGAENRPLPVVIRTPGGVERVIELRCISYVRARALDLEHQEKIARMKVSGVDEKISYLKVPDMSRHTIDELGVRIYQESLRSEGMVLDLRNNGGGREADRMLAMFCQPQHSFTVTRGGPAGYPQARRVEPSWSKPLVVLCNQNTYSNSEIFCHAIQQIERAPLVGTTTAGGVISAVKTSIPDAGELQVPFRSWFHAATGKNLELNGAQPDFPVMMTPADEHGGSDPPLAKALEVLQDALKELPPPLVPQR